MNKKNLLVLIIIIILYLIISFGIDFLTKINNIYIVFPDNINIKYEKKWQIFTDEKTLKNKYQIIENGNPIESSKLTIKDDIIVGNNIELINDTIAYKGSKVSSISYEKADLNSDDYSYLNQILKSKNIIVDIKLTLNSKYLIDLNNDGKKEIIYSISNNYDTEIGKLFSITIVKNNNHIIQYNEFSSEYDSYVPSIYFIDINNDQKADMIIKNIYASLTGQDIKVLKFENDLSYEYIFEEEIR